MISYLLNLLRQTVELVRRAEHSGASFLTVHGRTPSQRDTEPTDYEAIAMVFLLLIAFLIL